VQHCGTHAMFNTKFVPALLKLASYMQALLACLLSC
jgi:hypothetical protein